MESSSSYKESFMEENLKKRQLPPEVEKGNVEYKLHLVSPTQERLEHLVTQMKWRLAEGYGEAMYEIGVSDSGELVGLDESDMKASISTLEQMAQQLQAEISTIRSRRINENGKSVAEIMIRKSVEDDQHFLEIRVAILGGEFAGKSTLLGVLAEGELDNGRGKSRLNLLRHRHEIETGRTSSISRQIIGFNPKGDIVNFSTTNMQTWEQICEVSSKIVSFLDTCGDPKYQNTTISGLTGTRPDCACLIVNANGAGISEVSREHLGIAVVLKVPIVVVITKIDICTSEQLTSTLQGLFQLLKSPGLRRIPLIIENEDDVVVSVSNFENSNVIPIFLTSCVTGENINLFKKFLNLIPKNGKYEHLQSLDLEYQIEEVYSVPQVGTVVGGLVQTGQLRASPSKVYYVGPDRGKFVPCKINTIHRQRCPVSRAVAGQAVTLAVEVETKFKFRKGQVILGRMPLNGSRLEQSRATWEFDAELHVLYHQSSLLNLAQGQLFVGSVRQPAKIIRIYTDGPDCKIKTGDVAKVKMRFLNEPEWMHVGRTVLFREGRMKCVGKVIAVNPH